MQTFDQRVFRTGFSAKAPRLRWVARALPLSRPTNGEVLRQHCLVMGGSATSRSGAWLRVAIGSQIAGLCENRDQSARQQPTGSSNRDTIERCVTSSLREREAHDETRLGRPRFGQVFLGLFRRVIGSKESRWGAPQRTAASFGRHELPVAADGRDPSAVQRARSLKRSLRGR